MMWSHYSHELFYSICLMFFTHLIASTPLMSIPCIILLTRGVDLGVWLFLLLFIIVSVFVITLWAMDAVIRPSRCCFQLSLQPWPLVSSSIFFYGPRIIVIQREEINSCIFQSTAVGSSSAVTDVSNEYRTQAFDTNMILGHWLPFCVRSTLDQTPVCL